MHPATRRFLLESWRSTRSVLQTLHGYLYLRWPDKYIGMLRDKGTDKPQGLFSLSRVLQCLPHRWIERLTNGFAEGYHAKVMPPGSATKLIRVERFVNLPQPESVLPYSQARDLILNENAAVALMHCPCRLTRENPCEPLDVCILVGDVVVDFALAHHPHKSRRVSPEEAVEVVRRCNERGMVTHAFFKHAVLDRFYAICNCCACCCGAMQGHFHGIPMLCASGYGVEVSPTVCKGCGLCVKRCPFNALQREDGPGSVPVVDLSRCMGCGVCTLACQFGALSLKAPDSSHNAIQPLVL